MVNLGTAPSQVPTEGLGRFPPEVPGSKQSTLAPGEVPAPYLSYPALLIYVELALLPEEDLGTPALAVTHY